VLDNGQQPTEAALRWRLRAASLDYLIVYVSFLGLCAAFHWRVATVGHVVVLAVAVAAYHFVLESFGGQTFGKARYGLQVVSLDGRPASAKAIAIRSVLRVVDQFPLCYVSGLISMVRTGPARRQRIGDVAAETKVIAVDGVAVEKGTPSWMLPVATMFAVIVSSFYVYKLAEYNKQPLSSADQAQFIAGCESSPGAAALDCGCALNQLEADGYVTLDSLETMMVQALQERASGQQGTARRELTAVGLACRR
jgi:uncharacterized RDD family membrane protein YckC